MSKKDLFHYTQSGLDDVWLASGFRRVDTEYGAGFAVEHARELHQAIARAVVERPYALRGQEVRFLRSVLKLSQADLGRLLGVDRTTVVRWEGARDVPVGRMADLALRATYAARSGDTLVAATIRALQDADEKRHGDDYRAVFAAKNDGWMLVAA